MTQLTGRMLLLFFGFIPVLLGRCSSETNSLTGPDQITLLRVFVRNDTASPFSLGTNSVPPGESVLHMSHSPYGTDPQSPFGRSFDISRDGEPVARVTYRVLKYEERARRDVSISISEPSRGQFSATTRDTMWIAIAGVQHL